MSVLIKVDFIVFSLFSFAFCFNSSQFSFFSILNIKRRLPPNICMYVLLWCMVLRVYSIQNIPTQRWGFCIGKSLPSLTTTASSSMLFGCGVCVCVYTILCFPPVAAHNFLASSRQMEIHYEVKIICSYFSRFVSTILCC